MALADVWMRLEESMKANFLMTRRKDLAKKSMLIKASILEIGKMTARMAKENVFGRMEHTILEIGQKTNITDLEKNLGPMEINMWENGRITENTAKEPISGPMETDTKVRGMRANKMDLDNFSGLPEPNTLETSRRICAKITKDSLSGPTVIDTWAVSKIT